MAVKIRLRRMGAKKAPFYRVVVADSRFPRDGRFIEEVGYYNPQTEPAEIKIDADKAKDWLAKGAQPTETVKSLLSLEYHAYEIIVVDDLKPGYDMARGAGVDFAAAGWAYDVKEIREFMKQNCDFFLETIDDLKELIK